MVSVSEIVLRCEDLKSSLDHASAESLAASPESRALHSALRSVECHLAFFFADFARAYEHPPAPHPRHRNE